MPELVLAYSAYKLLPKEKNEKENEDPARYKFYEVWLTLTVQHGNCIKLLQTNLCEELFPKECIQGILYNSDNIICSWKKGVSSQKSELD